MSGRIKAVVITATGVVEERTISDSLENLQDIVGGYIEGVSPVDHEHGAWFAYCNEEGKLMRLPFNTVGTYVAHRLGWPAGDVLCGTVVFLGETDDGGDVDLPEETLAAIRELTAVAE